MQTLTDLENMKNIKCQTFYNQYDFFITRLEDDYIGKTDGLSRIKHELENWDGEAQVAIIEKLVRNISQSGIQGLDYSELRNLVSKRPDKVIMYFDESGNNGNVVPNKSGYLYRRHQPQFVLGCAIIKNSAEQDLIARKYACFKERWKITEEYKSVELLDEKKLEMLDDFIENILQSEHFHVCCYDKKFYLASLLSLYLLGNDMQINNPLAYFKYTSALAKEDDMLFKKYCEIVENPTNQGIEDFLNFILEFPFKKIDEEINPYKIAARFMIDNQNESGFCKPYLSKGEYEKAGNVNVINMNALGESILSICYNESITVDDVKVYHDRIEQYEDELITLYDNRIAVDFLDSKSNDFIQIADNLAGIFRRAFSETVEIYGKNEQWECGKERYPKLLSKMIEKLTIKNIKFVVPISDWALALTVHKMYSDNYPVQNRNADCFWAEFMRFRHIVETNIPQLDYSYSPD